MNTRVQRLHVEVAAVPSGASGSLLGPAGRNVPPVLPLSVEVVEVRLAPPPDSPAAQGEEQLEALLALPKRRIEGSGVSLERLERFVADKVSAGAAPLDANEQAQWLLNVLTRLDEGRAGGFPEPTQPLPL